ncbi:hypothetical protein AAIR98_001460 [Elusimicrobium simillimum]|uniref:Acb2/Tad1 domain-containing protein n=1 Tax=Elusimicrobium simillimum TaxID=3143438 RepID=UPI003C6EC591
MLSALANLKNLGAATYSKPVPRAHAVGSYFKTGRCFMDNQHRQIKGYRELDAKEIALMNKVKEVAELVGDVVAEVESESAGADKRWIAIGKTQLQQGFMAVVRSIAQPDSF